jgi:hypothetical protein
MKNKNGGGCEKPEEPEGREGQLKVNNVSYQLLMIVHLFTTEAHVKRWKAAMFYRYMVIKCGKIIVYFSCINNTVYTYSTNM